jgi:hypothetical protein
MDFWSCLAYSLSFSIDFFIYSLIGNSCDIWWIKNDYKSCSSPGPQKINEWKCDQDIFYCLFIIGMSLERLRQTKRIHCRYFNFYITKSFYYKEIQKEKKETGKVERALAIPDLMLGRYTVSLPPNASL